MIKPGRICNKKVKENRTSKKRTSKTPAKGEVRNARTANANATISDRPKSTRTGGQGQASAFVQETVRNHSGELSGDLQGLPEVEHLDSENLRELIEEGNAFEANVLTGIEDAEEHEGKEVHTHEVAEDDVRGEYLDQD